jgi:hypothetical protein
MNRPRDFYDHVVTWDSSERKIYIRPKHSDGTTTRRFGLGNALIRINTKHPPTKIVKKITGDSDVKKIAPRWLGDLGPWRISGDSFHVVNLDLKLRGKGTAPLTFVKSDSSKVVERKADAPFVGENYAVGVVGPSARLEW